VGFFVRFSHTSLRCIRAGSHARGRPIIAAGRLEDFGLILAAMVCAAPAPWRLTHRGP